MSQFIDEAPAKYWDGTRWVLYGGGGGGSATDAGVADLVANGAATKQAVATAVSGKAVSALSPSATVTASGPLTKETTTPVNGTAGPVAMSALPALSTLAVGDSYGLQKTDPSTNPVSVSFAGADATATGATSVSLTMPGKVTLRVVAAPTGGGKLWDIVNHVRSDATINGLPGAQAARRATLAQRCNYGVGQWFVQRSGPEELHWWREDLSDPGTYYDYCFGAKTGDLGGTRTPRIRHHRRGLLMRAEQVGNAVLAASVSVGPPPDDASEGYPQGIVLRGSMTAGSTTFTITSGGPFVQSIHRARKLTIPGAGPGGVALTSTIGNNPSGTSTALADAASTAVTDVAVTVWPTYWIFNGGVSQAGPAHVCTSLGFMMNRNNGVGGLMKITVSDGSVANCLPTAQQMVDTGLYPSTILVANGGTLAPTDRVWSPYAAKIAYSEPICAGRWATPASRSLTLINSGYAPIGSVAGPSVRVSGWLWADGTETPASLSGTDAMIGEIDLLSWEGNWILNYQHDAGNGSPLSFTGGEHGYEFIQSGPSVVVDGAPVTLGQWQTVAVPGEARVSMVTTIRHPNATTTDFARMTYAYRLTKAGLDVRHVNEWLVAVSVGAAFPFMLPANGAIFDRAQVDALLDPVDLSPIAVDRFVGQARSTAYVLYPSSAAGQLMTGLIIPEAAAITAGWYVNRGDLLDGGYIERRAAVLGPLGNSVPPSAPVRTNKIYVGRTTVTAAGDVWDNQALYVFGRNRGGLNRMLPVS